MNDNRCNLFVCMYELKVLVEIVVKISIIIIFLSLKLFENL